MNVGRRISKAVSGQCMEITWVAGKCNIRQRTPVCSRIDEGVKPDVGDKDKVVDSISSTDRWTD